jgi:hypothetical protein
VDSVKRRAPTPACSRRDVVTICRNTYAAGGSLCRVALRQPQNNVDMALAGAAQRLELGRDIGLKPDVDEGATI